MCCFTILSGLSPGAAGGWCGAGPEFQGGCVLGTCRCHAHAWDLSYVVHVVAGGRGPSGPERGQQHLLQPGRGRLSSTQATVYWPEARPASRLGEVVQRVCVQFFFFFFNYFWLCWISVAPWCFSSCSEQGAPLWLRYAGSSWWLLLSWSTGPGARELGSCGSRAPSSGSAVVAHGLSCPAACGSSQTKHQAHVSCAGRQSLYPWATTETMRPVLTCCLMSALKCDKSLGWCMNINGLVCNLTFLSFLTLLASALLTFYYSWQSMCIKPLVRANRKDHIMANNTIFDFDLFFLECII